VKESDAASVALFMRHTAVTAVIALLAAAASGCGASVSVDHWVAPPAPIDGARHIVVTDAFGRDGSVAAIGARTVDALRYEPWYVEVTDLTRRDRLESDGRDAWLRQGTMAADAIYVRLDVLEDLAVATAEERVVDNGDGTVSIVVEERVVAHTLLALTAADHLGIIVDELEIEGIHEVVGAVDDAVIDDAMNQAAAVAVAAAIAEITPRRTVVNVPIDERNDAVMAIVGPALDGGSMHRLQAADALAGDDDTAAIYNRAALLESVAALEEALPLYRAAAGAVDAPTFAHSVLEGAEQRLRDARGLGLR